jgi:hypothetical protein
MRDALVGRSQGEHGERFGLGQRPIGCERLHDLVLARARET